MFEAIFDALAVAVMAAFVVVGSKLFFSMRLLVNCKYNNYKVSNEKFCAHNMCSLKMLTSTFVVLVVDEVIEVASDACCGTGGMD